MSYTILVALFHMFYIFGIFFLGYLVGKMRGRKLENKLWNNKKA